MIGALAVLHGVTLLSQACALPAEGIGSAMEWAECSSRVGASNPNTLDEDAWRHSGRVINGTVLTRSSTSLPVGIHTGLGEPANARHPLRQDEIEAAIRKSLAALGGQISVKILDVAKGSYPSGQLEFPLRSAVPPPLFKPTSSFIWRGHETSGEGNSIPLWARVQVTSTRHLVRTKVDLTEGQVLGANDLESFDATVCPLLVKQDEQPKDYQGLLLKRSLRSGSQLLPDLVKVPPTVERGDFVPVEALIGRAGIQFEAQADVSGYPGQTIQLTNTSSRRHFRGVVRTDGSVLVRALPIQRRLVRVQGPEN